MKSVENQRGLSLIEVIVAIVLLGVGALAAVSMQRAAIRGNQAVTSVQQATAMAETYLEASRAIDYDDSRLAQTSGYVTPPSSLVQFSGASAQAGTPFLIGYSPTWRIQANTPIANVKHIRVRVRWSDRGSPREVELQTLRAQ